nr:nucleotide sugar dehydrogenase [Roseobacter sp. SK209-2-6]
MDVSQAKIAVIGLGYVGLPLAVEFGKKFPTIGFDIDATRIAELQAGKDRTLETEAGDLAAATELRFTADLEVLKACNTFIVTVPTPIDTYKRPDLSPLIAASQAVGEVISHGDVVIYESTVYPGATEEDCIPVVERISGLICNEDFFAGYSPERINPGDKTHRLPVIKKVTSGSTPETARYVDALYQEIITAGTHLAASIKVAEAAKVIENTQRDVNIALVNELALIFGRMGIDTLDVLEAAGTKWNFLPFRPGLVGGHCIGVDPYYLTHKAQELNYQPEIILAGRRINDSMGEVIADEVLKALAQQDLVISRSRVLVMGLTFKENCPDLRNTRVIDIIRKLQDFGITVDVMDPMADPVSAQAEYGIDLISPQDGKGAYSAIILAVPHRAFKELGVAKIQSWGTGTHLLFDLKGLFEKQPNSRRL